MPTLVGIGILLAGFTIVLWQVLLMRKDCRELVGFIDSGFAKYTKRLDDIREKIRED